MKIVFDLDGVIRSLNDYFKINYSINYPQVWYWKHKGKGFWDWCDIDKHMAPLNAPPTKYLPVIKKYCTEIWTDQPVYWRLKTRKWVRKHIGRCRIRYMNTAEKRARLDKEPDTLLIEDCPNFTRYNRIILIDWRYNRHIKEPVRVKTPKQLEHWLRLATGGKHARVQNRRNKR